MGGRHWLRASAWTTRDKRSAMGDRLARLSLQSEGGSVIRIEFVERGVLEATGSRLALRASGMTEAFYAVR